MEIIYLPQADEDLNYWIKTGNKINLKKIAQLTADILLNPYQGIGKPEQLKYSLSGKWSRRIDKPNRYIYSVTDTCIYVHSLKGHYD